jgi:Zn-dependent protease with chaperone function
MKKLCLMLVLIVGCATAPPYKPDPYLQERSLEIANKALGCIASFDRYIVHVVNSQDVNAWMDSSKHIYMTEGLLKLDKDSIMLISLHELGHDKLGHIYKRAAVSYGITTALIVANVFLPGVGLLNHAINPAVTNNFSKSQEFDADRYAAENFMRCSGISKEQIISIMTSLKLKGGGFWSTHPSLDDRVENIRQIRDESDQHQIQSTASGSPPYNAGMPPQGPPAGQVHSISPQVPALGIHKQNLPELHP